MHRHNNWNIAYAFLDTILICLFSSLSSVCDNTLHIVKAANTKEDTFPNSFNVTWMKQNYCHYCTQDPNQTAEKTKPPNEIIRVPSLQNSNQWPSITKKIDDDLYDVKLGWDSTNLKTGKNTIFIINFLNHKTNLQEKQIEYSFKAISLPTNVTIKDVKHQKAPTGSGVQIVKLPMLCQLNILVNFTFSQEQLSKIDTNNIENVTSNKSEYVSFRIMIPLKDVPSTHSLNTRI